jgi:hypothetical protein
MNRLTLTSAADPDFVQNYLQTALAMRHVTIEERRQIRQRGMTLQERIAIVQALETIDGWIYDARAWLAARGLPCREASAAGASMAQGCAAVALAVGPAPSSLESVDRHPAGSLFFEPEMARVATEQELDPHSNPARAHIHA